MKETEGPLKNGKGNLLTQVVRALFKGKKMKLILRLNVQRGEGTDARKRHKFPRGEREVLKEIKIILVLVIKKVECRGEKNLQEQTCCIPKCKGKRKKYCRHLEPGKHLVGSCMCWEKSDAMLPYG